MYNKLTGGENKRFLSISDTNIRKTCYNSQING